MSKSDPIRKSNDDSKCYLTDAKNHSEVPPTLSEEAMLSSSLSTSSDGSGSLMPIEISISDDEMMDMYEIIIVDHNYSSNDTGEISEDDGGVVTSANGSNNGDVVKRTDGMNVDNVVTLTDKVNVDIIELSDDDEDIIELSDDDDIADSQPLPEVK